MAENPELRMFTKDLDEAKAKLDRMFAGVYTREYIKNYIDILKTVKPDRLPSIDARIRRMFNTYNIRFSPGAGADEYMEALKNSKSIPNEKELRQRFVFAMYHLFERHKSPADYMERLVSLLIDPELDGDCSVRVKILRQFAKHADFLDKTGFRSPLVKEAFEDECQGDFRKIDDSFFNRHFLPQKLLQPYTDLKILIDVLGGHLLEDEAVDGRIAEILEENGFSLGDRKKSEAIFLISENFEKIKGNPAFVDSLLELVRKKKEITDKACGDSQEYSRLRTEYNDRIHDDKSNNNSIRLLKVCHDLAQGNFTESPRCRESLYLFAIAFNMTVFTGAPGEIRDSDRDIETRLFRDYYCNNVIRFLNPEYISGAATAEPSGMGINYRNFVEIVYLYYLNRQNMTPAKKIVDARETVKRVRREYNRLKKKFNSAKNVDTPSYNRLKVIVKKDSRKSVYFRQRFPQIGEIFKESEDVLVNYIINHFDIDASAAAYSNSKGFADRREHKCPKEALKMLLDENRELFEECYCEPFMLVSMVNLEGLLKDDKKYPQRDDFIRVLNKINDIIFFKGERAAAGLKNKKRINLMEFFNGITGEVTRTRLLVAYYYAFTFGEKGSGIAKNRRNIPFSLFYEKFCAGADVFLKKAMYEPVSSRNLFDMVLVFCSYYFMESLEE